MEIADLRKIVLDIVRTYEGLPICNDVKQSIYTELAVKTEVHIAEITEMATANFGEFFEEKTTATIGLAVNIPEDKEHVVAEECSIGFVLNDHLLEF